MTVLEFVSRLQAGLDVTSLPFDPADLGDLAAFAQRVFHQQRADPDLCRWINQFIVESLRPGSRIAFKEDAALSQTFGVRTGIIVATEYTAREFIEGRTPYHKPAELTEGDVALLLRTMDPGALDWLSPLVRVDPCEGLAIGAVFVVKPFHFRVIAAPTKFSAN